MKTSLILLVVTSAVAGCSSSPSGGSNPASAGAGASAGGQASTTAGAAGTVSGLAGAATGGAGGTTAAGGDMGVAGATTAGAPGNAGSAGSANGGAAGGVGGGAGAAGAAGGSPVDPGNLTSFIPAGYTGMPFGGTPQIIPGKIEIEKYDTGGANVAYKAMPAGGAFNKCNFMRTDALQLQCTQQAGSPSDKTAPGCGMEPAGEIYLGYINSGDWYKYTVSVVESGTYVISGHEGVAGNPQMLFTFTDALKTMDIALPSTNVCNFEAYHVWATQDNLGEITIPAGKYVLTITSVAAGMNLDWFAFTKKP